MTCLKQGNEIDPIRTGLLSYMLITCLSDLIEKAIKTWSLEMSSFLPQLARAIFVSSVITDRRGATEDAKTLLRQAADLRRKILQAQPISDDKLQQENFDALVVFASR